MHMAKISNVYISQKYLESKCVENIDYDFAIINLVEPIKVLY